MLRKLSRKMACDILLVIRSLSNGGAERQLALLARELHLRGYDVRVGVLYRQGSYIGELREAGVPIVDFSKQGRWDVLGVLKRILAFLADQRPKVVYSFMQAENVLLLALKPWIRRYSGGLVCGLRVASHNPRSHGLASWMLNVAQKHLLPLADLVISNSAKALSEMHASLPKGRGLLVPNGIEIERFTPSPEARSTHRANWGLANQDIAIGLFGRLDPQKNHRLAVEALALLKASQPSAKLVCVGSGSDDYRAGVQAHAERLGVGDRLIWTGAVADMAAAYAAIDVLCLASLAEGFPNVLGEAMSAGLPCVATDVGDCAAVLGDCGWIVPSGDAEGLATALKTAINSISQWDKTKSIKRVSESYSVNMLTDLTIKAISTHIPGSQL